MRLAMIGGVLVVACGGGSGDAPDAGGDSPDAGACGAPLPADTLANLTHSAWFAPAVELQPGQNRDLELGTVGLGGGFETVAACATWSVAPATGAAIDPATGVLAIEPGVASGTTYVVTADVESGRKRIAIDVVVFTPAAMPWHGVWREANQLECGSGAEVAPEEVINEIYFWANGTLWVTWQPFEVYVDYWGTHAFAPASGAVMLTSSGGNYVPTDIDGEGTYELTGGELVLRDLWLGSPQGVTAPARCGHRLIR